MRRYILLLLIAVAPAGVMRADVLGITGSGGFSCGFEYHSAVGYMSTTTFSFTTSDGTTSGDIELQNRNVTGCDPSTLILGGSLVWLDISSGGHQYGTTPEDRYYGTCAVVNEPPGAGITVPYDHCALSVSIDQNYLSITLSDTYGYEAQMKAFVTVTSVESLPKQAFYGSQWDADGGSFIIGTPEPATCGLLACAAPLLFVCKRRKNC